MKKISAAGAPPYSHRSWLSRIEAAQEPERSDLAIEWLDAYVKALGRTRLSKTLIWSVDFTRDMRILRSLAKYVPPDHDYFKQRPGGIEHTFNLGRSLLQCEITTVSSDENSFGYPVEITTTSTQQSPWAKENLALARDLWLTRGMRDRRSVLMTLGADRAKFDAQVHHAGAPVLLCEAAWNASDEAGKPADMIAAATRVTLWAARSYTIDDISGNEIRRAISTLLRRCLLGPDVNQGGASYDEIKETLVAEPVACATTLLFIEESSHLNTAYLYPNATTSLEAFDILVTWLPRHRSMLELSSQMGLSSIECLKRLVTDIGTTPPSMDLPPEINGTMDFST